MKRNEKSLQPVSIPGVTSARVKLFSHFFIMKFAVTMLPTQLLQTCKGGWYCRKVLLKADIRNLAVFKVDLNEEMLFCVFVIVWHIFGLMGLFSTATKLFNGYHNS